MGAVQEVFKRVEKKYMMTTEQYERFMSKIQDRMNPDKYPVSTIYNIYFDTPGFELIRRSMEKPVYKEKLRFRTYCIPNADSEAFIELKKKFKGVVYKRRIDMRYEDALNYLFYRQPPIHETQITKEVDWALNFYRGIKPAMFIYYDRRSFYSKENPNLRITFDTNITWRETNLLVTEGNWGTKLLDDDKVLMEIKIPGAMPLWLSKILDEEKIYPRSFSKYANAYTQLLMRERQMNSCQS